MTADDLAAGKAAEHIVCADLLMMGHSAHLASQGSPYDIILDISGRLYRVQVKGCRKPYNVNARGRAERLAYSYGARRCGKGGKRVAGNDRCDLWAFVALDIRSVAYMPTEAVGLTVQLRPPGFTFMSEARRVLSGLRFEEMSLEKALSGDLSFYKQFSSLRETCKNGHTFDEENTHVTKLGYRMCRTCSREAKRITDQRKKLNAA